jgi:hypothetical protein
VDRVAEAIEDKEGNEDAMEVDHQPKLKLTDGDKVNQVVLSRDGRLPVHLLVRLDTPKVVEVCHRCGKGFETSLRFLPHPGFPAKAVPFSA